MQCKICTKTFDSDKGLHSHFRSHKIKIKDYYERFYPKLCLASGKKLSWKDGDTLENYLNRDFVDKISLNQYFKSKDNLEIKKELLLRYLDNSIIRHGTLLSQVELASLPIHPNFLTYGEYFNLQQLLVGQKYPIKYNYQFDYSKKLLLPKVNPEDFTIIIDTREQQSYRFFSSIRSKLDVGDYTLGGNLFNSVVVERKSVSDFGGTVVAGNERFRRELDRVRESKRYLIVLVEYNVHEIYKHKFYGYSNPAFVAHNMRELIRDYSDCVQFVFGGDRESCVNYVAEFLLYGQKCKEIDLQLYVDYQKFNFRTEEFTKEDLLKLLC